MSAKKHSIDMTTGPLLGKIFTFAIPLMLTSIIQISFNAVDLMVVGRFTGDDALAAVGATAYVVNLIVNFFVGFSVGSGILLSQAVGSKNSARIKTAVHTAMLSGVIIGLLVAVLGQVVNLKQCQGILCHD